MKSRNFIYSSDPYCPSPSELLSRGEPIFRVSRWLGHASIQLTADTYGHLIPQGDEHGALDRIATEGCATPIRTTQRRARQRRTWACRTSTRAFRVLVGERVGDRTQDQRILGPPVFWGLDVSIVANAASSAGAFIELMGRQMRVGGNSLDAIRVGYSRALERFGGFPNLPGVVAPWAHHDGMLEAGRELLATLEIETRSDLARALEEWPDELHPRFLALLGEMVFIAATARRVGRGGDLSYDEIRDFLRGSVAFFKGFACQ